MSRQPRILKKKANTGRHTGGNKKNIWLPSGKTDPAGAVQEGRRSATSVRGSEPQPWSDE